MVRFSLYLVSCLLLLSQSLTVLHAADGHAEKHEHNGEVCSIYLYSETASPDVPSSEMLLTSPIVGAEKAIKFDTANLTRSKYTIKIPRAPPVNSPV